jgi:hypothetical protein
MPELVKSFGSVSLSSASSATAADIPIHDVTQQQARFIRSQFLSSRQIVEVNSRTLIYGLAVCRTGSNASDRFLFMFLMIFMTPKLLFLIGVSQTAC